MQVRSVGRARESAEMPVPSGAVGMSFGLSACPEDDGTVTHLVKVADERLFLNKREKENGRPGLFGLYSRQAAGT